MIADVKKKKTKLLGMNNLVLCVELQTAKSNEKKITHAPAMSMSVGHARQTLIHIRNFEYVYSIRKIVTYSVIKNNNNSNIK